MDEGEKNTKPPYGFETVFIIIGVGLLAIGVLETIGLMRYRPHREPLGAPFWFVAGSIALAVGWAIKKARS